MPDFRSLEKLTVKKRKAELDVNFLKDCKSFNVFPKFICFPLPNVNYTDINAIRRRLLRSAISKRSRELHKLNRDLANKTNDLQHILSPVDWYILQKALDKNVCQRINKLLMTHRKKIKTLTKNKSLPFTHNETVTNLSSHQLKDEELELLKNGLNYSIKPPKLNETDILSTFEKIHYTLKTKTKDEESYLHLKNELIHMAQCYVSSYRPTPADLIKEPSYSEEH